jgi:pSer/pThr/pTyr-binding forkhead associated (FHA) protein
VGEKTKAARAKATGTGTVHIASGVLDASNFVEHIEVVPVLQATLETAGAPCVDVVLISDDDRFVIGRDSARCDEYESVVEDPRASRTHAAISAQDGIALVEDLSSSNGTYVNGERISGPTALKDGDTIRIGRTEFVFRIPPGGEHD